MAAKIGKRRAWFAAICLRLYPRGYAALVVLARLKQRAGTGSNSKRLFDSWLFLHEVFPMIKRYRIVAIHNADGAITTMKVMKSAGGEFVYYSDLEALLEGIGAGGIGSRPITSGGTNPWAQVKSRE